jgi:protein involved in polysaccharide export with SLBB domain
MQISNGSQFHSQVMIQMIKKTFSFFIIFMAILGTNFSQEKDSENARHWEETPISPPEKPEVQYLNDAVIESYYEPLIPPEPKIKEEPKESNDHYRLKFGDRLILSIFGEDHVHTREEVVVGADGNINYLFVTQLPAVGKTIPHLRESLIEQLKKFYREPLLLIAPFHFSDDYYTILGEVFEPGRKILNANSTLLSAFCEGYGFNTRLFRNQTVDTVDFERSFVARNGKYIKVDFESLIYDGNMRWDIPLKANDYVYLASKNISKVFVLGEVQRNAVIETMNGITLTQAISDAGGITDRASSRIIVIRGSLSHPRWFYIDSNLIFNGYAPDFDLLPKDIVYVPPLRFLSLRDVIRGGINAFVSIVFNVGGTNAFLEITPAAKATGVVSPVPVVGASTVPVTPPTPSNPGIP